MYFFFLILILICHTIAAGTYNNQCTQKCDFPGMVCVKSQCKCDVKNRLFWTGARCAPCPNDWTITETECITYYNTLMTWELAKSTCRSVKAELISFRSRNIIPLIYNATEVKLGSANAMQYKGWTSAHATDSSGSSSYRWLDKNAGILNDESDWWCKKNTLHLGYGYPYDEPTKLKYGNETEACVVFWHGSTTTQVVCLDDQTCSRQFAFICEKSESTAMQYIGPPPSINNLLTTNTAAIDGMKTKITTSTTTEAKKKSNRMIIFAIIGILILLAFIGGLVIFLMCRKKTGTPKIEINNKKESIPTHRSTIDDGSVLISNVAPKNINLNLETQKNKRGGYSKQQFDEFE